ncbi:hypothetical protein AAVH_24881 [Aphelenchoides avenae]|nr:hypothetical protein AAVH_24881 [Aphelenchus avenae]
MRTLPESESDLEDGLDGKRFQNSRYLANVKAFKEPQGHAHTAPKQEPLVATKPDPLPEQLKWIGLTAVNAYLQAKQMDENAEKAEDLEQAHFDWNFNRL